MVFKKGHHILCTYTIFHLTVQVIIVQFYNLVVDDTGVLLKESGREHGNAILKPALLIINSIHNVQCSFHKGRTTNNNNCDVL